MNFIEQVKGLISREEVKDASRNFLEDSVGALLGNPVSAGKIIISLAKFPLFFREQLFWAKMEMFLNGVFIDEGDSLKLSAKLTADGKEGDSPYRLIECIDRAQTRRKIQYLINATRCLLAGFIELEYFFRICQAITYTLEEDLSFLKVNITEDNEFEYDASVQGLLTSGLMFASTIGMDQRYSFTP